MLMYEQYLDRTEFDSYDDFKKNCKVKVPENYNFAYDTMDAIAAKTPDKLALKWCDVEGNYREFTFDEIKRLSCKAANFFHDLGIRKGDFVALILKRRYEFWISILALHRIGAVAIPCTHLLTPHDISYRNNAANIRAIISCNNEYVIKNVDEAMADSPSVEFRIALNYEGNGWINWDKGVEAASDVYERPVGTDQDTHNDDIMLLYFTSGTTGHPKMAYHDFRYPLGHIYTAIFWQRVDPNGVHLTVADSGWAKCAWGKIYGQWLGETCLFVYDFDKFIPDDMLRLIEKHKLTTFCAPPTIYRFFIKEDLSKYDLSSISHFCTAGEPLNPEVYSQILANTGLRIYEGFGQTESCVMMATFPGVEPRLGSMGKPSPAYDVVLLNDDDEPVELGEEGQICISLKDGHPLGLSLGYYKDEEKTADTLKNGYYHTGDIAWMDEDGYLWFVGRIDDVIKSSGYRIGPFEVESALLEHPSVLECAITGVPHPDRGQVVKATIVLAKGYEPSDELVKELQTHVKTTTAPYKYPRVVEFVDELPKTISGKVKRKDIRNNG